MSGGMSAAPEERAEGGASPEARRRDVCDSGGREALSDGAAVRGGDGGRGSTTSSPDGEPAAQSDFRVCSTLSV